MKKSQVNYPELPFNDTFTEVKTCAVKRSVGSHRATDSEGKFASEGTFPTTEVFQETEIRRIDSVWRILRLKEEEIQELKSQIEKYRCNE